MAQPMTPLEMLNQLIRMGLITPVSEHPNLMMPTLYRSVPSVASSGTGYISIDEGRNDAELHGAYEGNSQDAGGATGC
jgi:hypothetical protein